MVIIETHQGLIWRVIGEEYCVNIPVGKQVVELYQLRRRETQISQW